MRARKVRVVIDTSQNQGGDRMPVHSVLSPLPGTFYRRSAPAQPALKEEGDQVQPGDVIGIVEVMKQFSEVTADVAGTIVRFHVNDEGAVDAGTLLAEIDVP
jgi:acetyl-CoA carboxylase biotin carboxyl carrier protein